MDYYFPTYSSPEELEDYSDHYRHQDEEGQLPKKLADHYERYRMELCAYQIELNIAGRPAPYFRNIPRARPHFDKSKDYPDSLLSNDQQVIDLHWLWVQRKDEVLPTDPRFEQLFSNEEKFDFMLASELVRTVGWGNRKVKLLQISDVVEMELVSIVSSEVRKHRNQLKTEHEAAITRIRKNSSKLKTAELIEWGNFFVVLRMAKGDTNMALRLYQTMVGAPTWSSHDSAIRQMATKRRRLEQDYLKISRKDWTVAKLF